MATDKQSDAIDQIRQAWPEAVEVYVTLRSYLQFGPPAAEIKSLVVGVFYWNEGHYSRLQFSGDDAVQQAIAAAQTATRHEP